MAASAVRHEEPNIAKRWKVATIETSVSLALYKLPALELLLKSPHVDIDD
jgi:hypothetical protein